MTRMLDDDLSEMSKPFWAFSGGLSLSASHQISQAPLYGCSSGKDIGDT